MPAQTGLTLGNINQQWIGYLSSAFTGNVQSLTANAALSGFIRLASTDGIAWRNNANSADVTLSKTGAASTTTPADTLVFGGSGIEGPFISHNGNPAAAGELRLNNTDLIAFRNNANNNDVTGLQHNSDDTVTAGGAGGIKEPQILSSVANPASGGFLRLASGDQINWRNAGNSADEGLSNASTGGLLVNGANPNISFGGLTASFPMIQRSGTGLKVRLADNSADAPLTASGITLSAAGSSLSLGGIISNYNGSNTTGVGVPYFTQGNIALIGQQAAIGTTNLFVGPPVAHMYRVSYYAYIVVGGNAVNLTVVIGWSDGVTSKTLTSGNIACNTSGASSATGTNPSPFIVYLGPTQNITYATGLSGAIGAGSYALNIVVETIQ